MKPTQYLGYNEEADKYEMPFRLPEIDPVCMVIRITNENIKDLKRETGLKLKKNTYLLSIGSCQNITIKGPYRDIEKAFDKGKELAGAVRYKTIPEEFKN